MPAVAVLSPSSASGATAASAAACPPARWRLWTGHLLAAALLATSALGAGPAQAHGGGDAASGASTASSLALSLPVASVAATGLVVLSGTAALTVVAVQASAVGTVWVLERAVDGSRVVVQVSGRAARGASVAVGQTLGVVALSTGLVLTASGEVLCFVLNATGAALLHHERLTY